MIKNKNIIWILLAWLGLSLSQNWFSVMDAGPTSVHQWAQADRASVALRFAETNAPIWLPRVHNLKEDSSGISGMEFPLMNYAAGKIYQLAGFDDSYYRALMWTVMGFGFGAMCLIFLYFEFSIFVSLSIPLILCSSPVLSYYTPSFLPDTASLALSLWALLCMIKWIKKPSVFLGLSWLLFISLAALIKITAFIFLFAFLGLMIFKRFGFIKDGSKAVPVYFWFFCFLSIAIVTSWFGWSQFLNRKYSSTMFLASSNPVKGIQNFIDCVLSIFKGAGPFYLSAPGWILAGLGVFAIIKKSIEKWLFSFVLIVSFGSILFLLLMLNQFREHDYYIIVLLGVVFLYFLAAAFKWRDKLDSKKGKWILGLCVILSLIQGLMFQIKRYDADFISRTEYAHREQLLPVGDWVRKNLERNPQGEVMYIFEWSNNVSLYFMNLRGFIINPGTPEDYYSSILTNRPIDLLLVNDTSCFSKSIVLQKNKGLELAVINGIHLYSVKKHE